MTSTEKAAGAGETIDPPLVCKNNACQKTLDREKIVSGRVKCTHCGFINLAAPGPLIAVKKRFTAECIGEYDSANRYCSAQCNLRPLCRSTSPPTDVDYWCPAPSNAEQQPTACPVCGHVDTGLVCSLCGCELRAARPPDNVVRRVLDALLLEPSTKYLRTLGAALANTISFVAGALSEHPARFHRSTKTLEMHKFFVTSAGLFATIETLLVGLFANATGNPTVSESPVLFALGELWNVVPWLINVLLAALLVAPALLYHRRKDNERRVAYGRAPLPRPRRVFHSVYVSVLISFAMLPFFAPGAAVEAAFKINIYMVANDAGKFSYETWAVAALPLVLSIAAAMFQGLWLLPNSLRYATRTPYAIAAAAVLITSQILGMVDRALMGNL